MDSHIDGIERVLVGVNGSSHSLTAVEVGTQEAILRGIGLHLLHVIEWPDIDLPISDTHRDPVTGPLRDRAVTVLTEATARARQVDSTITVTTEIVVDATRSALVNASTTACLTVVGRRPGMATWLPDPVGVHLAARARGPVIIAQGTSETRANVIAGIAATAVSAPVLEFAFREAALRGTGLTAVHVEGSPTHAAARLGEGRAEDKEDAIVALSEALEGFQSSYPEVDVSRDLVEGSTHDALEASAWAQMLVIGAPDAGPARRIHGAWINHALLRHARCPVAVAHSGEVRR